MKISRNWTHIRRIGLRINPFESQGCYQYNLNPPDPQNCHGKFKIDQKSDGPDREKCTLNYSVNRLPLSIQVVPGPMPNMVLLMPDGTRNVGNSSPNGMMPGTCPTVYHWNSGFSEFRKSGFPEFRNSGNPEFRKSGIPEIRESGNPDFPDFQTFVM